MKVKYISGLVTICLFLSLIFLTFTIQSSAELVESFYVKLAIVNLVGLMASAGIYLVDAHMKERPSSLRKLAFGFGFFLPVFAVLVSFEMLPFLKTWNWMIVLAVLYILLIQLLLLNWRGETHVIVKLSTFVVTLSDLFLIIFFAVKWHFYELEFWINLAMILSLVFTAVGLVFLRNKNKS